MLEAWAIFPSGNSETAQICADAWKAAGWNTAVLIDADQPAVNCDVLIREPEYRGTSAAFNKIMRMLNYRFVACINDDMFPVDCTPEKVSAVFAKAPSKHVLQPTGCWFDAMAWCAPCPIIDDTMGGPVWNEEYYHLGCDCELKDVADRCGIYLATKELAIEHRHKSLGFTDTLPPEKRKRNNERHAADMKLYQERKAAGFP